MSFPKVPKNQVISKNTISQREHEDDAAARRVVPVDLDGDFFGTPTNPISVISGTDAAASDPIIYNLDATLADTEYSQVLPDHTTAVLIRVRDGNAAIQLAFSSGDSSLNYLTVGMGNNFSISGVDLVGKTLYFQVNKPSKVVEILAWT